MWRDPIVEEVRRNREQYAARFSYDIREICRVAREKQKEGGRKVVSRPPRRAVQRMTPGHQPIA